MSEQEEFEYAYRRYVELCLRRGIAPLQASDPAWVAEFRRMDMADNAMKGVHW